MIYICTKNEMLCPELRVKVPFDERTFILGAI